MSEEYSLLRDIVYEHNERIRNLKKCYPFFKLAENSFQQYKEGKYVGLDMGYIMMAVLRFFMEENNFKEKDVAYEEYAAFLHVIFQQDFALYLEEEEEKELAAYIFDKLTNEGHPFSYQYFDPGEKKKKTVRTRWIESKMKEEHLYYTLSADGIAFYLETKEMKEESTISVAQVLLSKMISSQNFKGGIQVIRRINNEVSRLKIRKQEVLSVLSNDVFEGKKAYDDFVATGMQWFEEEQKLFVKNKQLIEKALEQMDNHGRRNMENSNIFAEEATKDIYRLEEELKKAIVRHSQLLHECTDLQYKADEMIRAAKFSKLRQSFDFSHACGEMMKMDSPKLLQLLVNPLLCLKTKKAFSLTRIDDMLTVRSREGERGEKVKVQIEENYVYPDELEEERIQNNYRALIRSLLQFGKENESFMLYQWNESLIQEFTPKILENGDYYSFLVHMCQKKEYPLAKLQKMPDTFFEKQVCLALQDWDKKEEYLCYQLLVQPDAQKKVNLGKSVFEVSDIRFSLLHM